MIKIAKTAEEIQAKAQQMWDSFDDNEKHGVRFGLFPFAKMKSAEDEGFTKMAVPLMDIASKNGGMRA